MRIVYVTTSLKSKDFDIFNSFWSTPLNTSNQTFNNKMIRCLALDQTNEIIVISLRPYTSACSLKKMPYSCASQGNITFHYLKVRKNKILRYFSFRSSAKKYIDEADLIISETINRSCIDLACHLKDVTGLPLVGILTDNPYNISFVNDSYSKKLVELGSKCDAFITLTDKLYELYCPLKDKPSFKLIGLSEDELEKVNGIPEHRKFFYFGGALLKRYGVYELIDAFKQISDQDVRLVISGHHPEKDLEKVVKSDKRIRYVKAIPNKYALNIEALSVANINPRPYQSDLDQYSIPSKIIEYIASGNLTISMKNNELHDLLKDDILWVEDSSASSLKNQMEAALKMTPAQKSKMTSKAKKKIKELTSLSNVSPRIQQFLLSLKK